MVDKQALIYSFCLYEISVQDIFGLFVVLGYNWVIYSVELHQCSVFNSFSKISDWRIVADKPLWRILSV